MAMNLINAAHDLALEIRDGVWDHVDCLRAKPAGACPEIIEELRRRSLRAPVRSGQSFQLSLITNFGSA